MQELTQEQLIAKHYSACMDSVNLINELKAKGVLTADESMRISANKAHLNTMLAKDFWTTEDLTPLKQAAA